MSTSRDAEDWEAKWAESEAMRQTMPTEAALPLSISIGRSWPSGGRPSVGWWHGIIDAGPVRSIWDCSHSHTTEQGAWECAMTALRIIVERKKNPGDYSWEARDEGEATAVG